jgi:hypothetical protein
MARTRRFRLACLAIQAGVMTITPAAARDEPIRVDATATVVPSRSISSETATRVLLNQSTGVMTIAIPGLSNGNSTAMFSFNNVKPIAQGFEISATGQNATVLEQLIGQLGIEDSNSRFEAELVRSKSVSGSIDPNGFQLIVVEVVRLADGSGYLRAIVPFN